MVLKYGPETPGVFRDLLGAPRGQKSSMDSFKVQGRSMHFNITKYKKLIDIVSDSTLQLTFKRLPLVEIWHSIKEKFSQLYKKAVKMLSFSQYMSV